MTSSLLVAHGDPGVRLVLARTVSAIAGPVVVAAEGGGALDALRRTGRPEVGVIDPTLSVAHLAGDRPLVAAIRSDPIVYDMPLIGLGPSSRRLAPTGDVDAWITDPFDGATVREIVDEITATAAALRLERRWADLARRLTTGLV